MRVDAGDGWAQVVARWKLTPCEARALRDIYAGEKFEAIGRKYGGTAHAIDKHWREIQRKMSIKGRVLVVRVVAECLAEFRQARAVEQAVEVAVKAATDPLQAAIAERDQTIASLQEQVRELEGRSELRSDRTQDTGD